jgi:hypothetical protein
VITTANFDEHGCEKTVALIDRGEVDKEKEREKVLPASLLA